jgi:hypothetical protein
MAIGRRRDAGTHQRLDWQVKPSSKGSRNQLRKNRGQGDYKHRTVQLGEGSDWVRMAPRPSRHDAETGKRMRGVPMQAWANRGQIHVTI